MDLHRNLIQRVNVGDALTRVAFARPDSPALVDGDRRFTYGEFAERTHRLAGALRALGIRAGDRVSFLCPNTHHLLEAYYGVLEAGAVLNPINVRLTPADIAYILNHSASVAVFCHRDFAPLLEGAREALTATRHFVAIEGGPGGLATHEYEALLAGGSPEYVEPAVREDDVAEIRTLVPGLREHRVAGAGHMIPWDNEEGFYRAFGDFLGAALD